MNFYQGQQIGSSANIQPQNLNLNYNINPNSHNTNDDADEDFIEFIDEDNKKQDDMFLSKKMNMCIRVDSMLKDEK